MDTYAQELAGLDLHFVPALIRRTAVTLLFARLGTLSIREADAIQVANANVDSKTA